MAQEQVNPFEQQPQPAWGGMTTLTPQGGQEPNAGGSSFQLSPEAMQMLWAPQMPPPQPPPQINPYA